MSTGDLTTDVSETPAVLTPEGIAPTVVVPPVAAAQAPAAPAKRSMRFLVGSLAGGNLISAAMNMVGGVLMMHLVGPSVQGLFTSIGLVQQYIPLLVIGIPHGLNRELPFYIGRGAHHRVKELAAVAQAWSLFLGAICGLILVGVGIWQLAIGNLWPAAAWFTNAVLAVLLFYNTWYLQLTYRTANDFARLALVSVVQSSTALVLLVLVWYSNFYGMCLRAMLVSAAATALLHYWRPVKVAPKWRFHHFKHLLIIGGPIFIVNQILSLWVPINNWLVLYYTGTIGVGFYYVAITAINALEVLPLALTAVLYPRMAEHYGRTGNARGLLRIAWKPTLLTFLGMIPILVVCWFCVEPAVRIVRPDYLPAVPCVKWSLLTPLLTCLAPVGLVFNVVRRQDLYAIAVVLGIAAYYVALRQLFPHGAPIEQSLTAFPMAMAIGRMVYVITSCALVGYLQVRSGPKAETN